MSMTTLDPETRRQLHETDPRWHIKGLIRIVATIFALLSFAMFGASIPTWNANFFHTKGPQPGDWQDGLPIAGLALAFLFNILNLAYLWKLKSTFSPVIYVIIDFLVWGLLLPGIVFAAWGGLFQAWTPAVKSADGRVICNINNVFSRECNPVLYDVGSLELAGVIFACLVWLLHFTLFVMACVDIHTRRMKKRANFNRRTQDIQEEFNRTAAASRLELDRTAAVSRNDFDRSGAGSRLSFERNGAGSRLSLGRSKAGSRIDFDFDRSAAESKNEEYDMEKLS